GDVSTRCMTRSAAVAVAALYAERQATREGADPKVEVPRGRPRCHCRPQPPVTGLGKLLPHRERRAPFQSARHLRVAEAPHPACEAKGTAPPRRRGRSLGPATTSTTSDFTACAAPSATRSSPSGNRRPRNAPARAATRKPCAGNPHARFE